MKYTNTHHQLPIPGQPVYFIGPISKEILGTFVNGQLFFRAVDGSIRGYYSKWWRALTEEELVLLPEIPEIPVGMVLSEDGELKKKRGRKKKIQ